MVARRVISLTEWDDGTWDIVDNDTVVQLGTDKSGVILYLMRWINMYDPEIEARLP
jgi:hypothetical protein